MMKKCWVLIPIILLACVMMLLWKGCKQYTAKNFGGSYIEYLPKNKKVVNVTWKNNNMWILTRDSKPGETSQKYFFKESSLFGVLEGEVTIVEDIQ